MKTEYDITKYNAKKSANKKFKFKFVFKRFLKATLFLIAFALAYFLSYKYSGFYKTNVRLLTLIVCMGLGFGLFFLIYYIATLFAKISYNKKTKKAKNNSLVYTDELNAMLYTQNYDFHYDFNLNLVDNFKNAFSLGNSLVYDIAKKYDKDGRYYYLNYTVYDSLLIVEDVTSGIYDRIDGFFKALKLQDLPLDVVEKKLLALIETEKKADELNELSKTQTGVKKVISTIKKNVLHIGTKVTTFVFKNKIEETVNDIIKYVGEEAFKIYGQRKVIKPTSNKGVEL